MVAGMVAVVVCGVLSERKGSDDHHDSEGGTIRNDNDNDDKGCVAIGSLGDTALALGSIGYLFLVHFLVLPIESSMAVAAVPPRDETVASFSSLSGGRFETVVARTFVVCGAIGGLFGIAGYLLFGNETRQIVLLNVEGGVWMNLVRSLLCIDLLLTYPVVMRPSIDILEKQWLKHSRTNKKNGNRINGSGSEEDEDEDNDTVVLVASLLPPLAGEKGEDHRGSVSWGAHLAVCTLLGIVAAGAGTFVPAFGLLSGLVGGVSQTFLAFVLPPIMWSAGKRRQPERDEREQQRGCCDRLAGSVVPGRLPWREGSLVWIGAGLIVWTLHSAWIEVGSGDYG